MFLCSSVKSCSITSNKLDDDGLSYEKSEYKMIAPTEDSNINFVKNQKEILSGFKSLTVSDSVIDRNASKSIISEEIENINSVRIIYTKVIFTIPY